MADRYLTFHVNRMPDGTIHGQATGCVDHEDGRTLTWLTTPYGVLAKDAFPHAIALAQEHGITQIGINDPALFAALGFGSAVQPTA